MGQRLAAVGNEVKAHPAGVPAGCLAWIIHEDAPFCNQPLERGVYLPMFTRTACDVGLLGAGGRFPAIWPQARNSARKRYFRAIVFGMPVSPIVTAIGSDGRAETGSEIGSPSSRALHELSRLDATTGLDSARFVRAVAEPRLVTLPHVLAREYAVLLIAELRPGYRSRDGIVGCRLALMIEALEGVPRRCGDQRDADDCDGAVVHGVLPVSIGHKTTADDIRITGRVRDSA